jgi:hypothetical protein
METSFLLDFLHSDMQRFDTEGVKKQKKRDARWGRKNRRGERESGYGLPVFQIRVIRVNLRLIFFRTNHPVRYAPAPPQPRRGA